MRKLFSKFARLYVADTTKREPFAVFIDDEDGFYIKGLKKEIKKYPKLKELTLKSLLSKKLSQLEEGDIIVFGDSEVPFDYDFRVVELADVRSTKGFKTLELSLEYKNVLAALKTYHKNNYPGEHKLIRKSRRSFSPPEHAYYSRLTGKTVRNIDLQLEVPRALLKKYGEIKVEVEVPKKWLSSKEEDVIIGRKKKVAKENYVIHQNFVKVGMNGYNIYSDKKNREYVNVKGTKYEIVRRSGKKDFLVEL